MAATAKQRCGIVGCALVVVLGLAGAAAAQAPVAVSGGIDVTNKYMFRGIRQNASGVAIWPALDVALTPFTGDGGLKSFVVNLGTWNSLHTSPSGWYESDVYASMTFNGAKAAFTTTYTSYTSPNDAFTHVKEVMFKAAVTDAAALLGLKLYAAVAIELGASPGTGQADGGQEAGTYVEIGMSPSIPLPKNVTLSMPTKFGFSASNYYEHPAFADGGKFGYSSMAGIFSVPLGEAGTPGGHWTLRGGVEYQGLGSVTAAFNGGDKSQVIGSLGLGFSY